MKKFLFLFAIAFILFTFPLATHAVCTKSGMVVRVTARSDGSSTSHYIYLRTSALSNVYYRVSTTDDDMVNVATAALTSQTRVTIQGSGSCTPPSLGTLRYIVVNP